MLTYLMWVWRSGDERRIDWLFAAAIDVISTAWVVFVTAAAVKVFSGG
jgi:hypothetical protein